MRRGRSVSLGVGLAQALVAASVLGGVFAWGHIPWLFGAIGERGWVTGFWTREMVRLAVCAVTMVPPALFIGASYPLAMECVGRGSAAGARVNALGRAAAVNTLGNVAGALVGGFVLLPRFGSLHALQILGCASLALAIVSLVACAPSERRVLTLGVALAAMLVAIQPRSFDLSALASGANVYFRWQGWGDVLDHAESADGGLTSVAVEQQPGGPVVKTLLTNGKFQGNDASPGEVAAQISFALVPLLHEEHRDAALVIGFGTGTTTRVVADAGFAHVDVADLSADILRLADRHFASVNDHVLERPVVHAHVTDGRNFLMLEPRTYDSHHSRDHAASRFAGAASLYNTDFYRLAKPRLAKGGVLQQWVQLHHLDEDDYVAILSSMRAVFRNVWLYAVDNQGLLIACDEDCAPRASAVERIEQEPALRSALSFLPGGTGALLQSRMLTPEAIDAFLARAGEDATAARRGGFELTDDNLFLEYSTPRGNIRDYDESLAANVKTFQSFAPPSPLAGTHLAPGVP